MTVGGWFDAEDLYGQLNIYKTIEANSSKAKNTIVMGPWEQADGHGKAETPRTSTFILATVFQRFTNAKLKENSLHIT